MVLSVGFYEVVAKRRSVRKFRIEPVPEEALNRVLEAGRLAPSAGNTQPWHFIVITDASVKVKIANVCTEFSRKAWANFSPETAGYLAARGGSWDKSGMAKVPVLIAVCFRVPQGIREELALGSAWATIENMLLAATAEGLGSCIYTFYGLEEENRTKEILGVPENYRIAAIIQLGYSAAEPQKPSRKELKEIVSYQHF
jgi:nitroreductase